MIIKWLPQMVGTVAIVMLLAACGGGNLDASATSASPALSSAQFQTRANAICSRAVQPVGDVVNKALRGGSGVKPVEAAVLPVAEQIASEVQALDAPGEEEQRVEEMLATLRREVEEARLHPSPSLEDFAGLFKRSGDIARRLGLASCALG